tara:strand:+ start:7432 stop:8559 length:1128 start_codon:yes stop_codon:yes gene_type:complete
MNILYKYYLYFILIIPFGLIKASSIYNITTPSFIAYDYLDYHLSLLLLPFALIFFRKREGGLNVTWSNMLMYVALLFLVLRNIYIINFGDLELVFAFDLILPMLFGFALYRTFNYLFSIGHFNEFLNCIVFFHFVGILASLIFGLNKIDFRFNAQNLDVGSTGMIFGLIFLIKTVYFKTDVFAILAFFILILSGSRFCLILTTFLFLMHTFAFLNGRQLTVLVIGGFIIVAYVPMLSDRFLSSITEVQDISDTSSLGGRLLSIVVGWQVLLDSFFSVNFSSINLVVLMNKFGYPTYPHSYFLISLIYFPFLAMYVVGKFIIKVLKHRNVANLYVLLVFLGYGGVTFNYKVYALSFILIYVVNKLDNSANYEVLNT